MKSGVTQCEVYVHDMTCMYIYMCTYLCVRVPVAHMYVHVSSHRASSSQILFKNTEFTFSTGIQKVSFYLLYSEFLII